MKIELGTTKILEGKILEARQSLRNRRAVCLNILEKRFDLRAIHQRSSSRAASMRAACCVTCFNGTECAIAMRLQSSYSGAAFAISPEGQRAIFTSTGPHSV